ncbi:Peroxisome biosynthesis protein pex1, partial [Coemansia sp. RSA 1694]
MVFRLSWGAASSAYVGWSGGVSSGGAGSLEIDGMFARQLGLADGARVGVSYVADVATCTAAAVEPASADDWEILSLNAGAVEERLLQQARVVAVGQPIVFWLSASTVVRLATASVTPSAHACCLLANDTEVIVAPRTRKKTQHAKPEIRSNIVCCLRVAAHAAVAEGVVYASTESPIIQLRGSSVRVGRAMPSIDSSHSSSSSAPSAGVPCESAWAVARLEASDGVQPGVLLAAPAMLRAAGLAAGELVRVVQDTEGDKDKKDAEEKEEEKEEKEEEKKEVVEEVAGMDAFLDDAWRSIDSALAAGGSGGGLLVCGRRGSGKTSVARALARRASASASAQAMRLRLV